MDDLFKMLSDTIASDREVSTQSVEKSAQKLTFKRDESGILWSYDANGNKVGRIYEHGDNQIDEIEEV